MPRADGQDRDGGVAYLGQVDVLPGERVARVQVRRQAEVEDEPPREVPQREIAARTEDRAHERADGHAGAPAFLRRRQADEPFARDRPPALEVQQPAMIDVRGVRDAVEDADRGFHPGAHQQIGLHLVREERGDEGFVRDRNPAPGREGKDAGGLGAEVRVDAQHVQQDAVPRPRDLAGPGERPDPLTRVGGGQVVDARNASEDRHGDPVQILIGRQAEGDPEGQAVEEEQAGDLPASDLGGRPLLRRRPRPRKLGKVVAGVGGGHDAAERMASQDHRQAWVARVNLSHERAEVSQVDVHPPVRHVGDLGSPHKVERLSADGELAVIVRQREVGVPVRERLFDALPVLQLSRAQRHRPDFQARPVRGHQRARDEIEAVGTRVQPRNEQQRGRRPPGLGSVVPEGDGAVQGRRRVGLVRARDIDKVPLHVLRGGGSGTARRRRKDQRQEERPDKRGRRLIAADTHHPQPSPSTRATAKEIPRAVPNPPILCGEV